MEYLYIGLVPFPVLVTTSVITFLFRNPYKVLFDTGILGGWGPQSKVTSRLPIISKSDTLFRTVKHPAKNEYYSLKSWCKSGATV